MHVTAAKRGEILRPRDGWFWFSFSLVERKSGESFVNQSQRAGKQNQSNYQITFDTQLKTALLDNNCSMTCTRMVVSSDLQKTKKLFEEIANGTFIISLPFHTILFSFHFFTKLDGRKLQTRQGV